MDHILYGLSVTERWNERIRSGRSTYARRLQAVHFKNDRYRQNVDADCEWNSGRRIRARRARRSKEEGDPLRGHRAGRLRFVRLRRALAGAAIESAAFADSRSGCER